MATAAFKIGTRQTAAAIALLAAMAVSATGADLRLRAQCAPAGAVVTLGDVAEVASADAKEAGQLAAVELFPAPTAQKRFLRVRELQDLLVLRGVDLARHQLSGANQVEILAGAPRVEGDDVSAAVSRRLQRKVQEAIGAYLKARSEAARDWTVAVELSEAQARRLAAAGTAELTVGGGTSPFLGQQQFDLAFDNAGKLQRMSVKADVSAPVAVVVPVRAISRGAILRESDLEMRADAVADGDGLSLRSLAEAVGKETLRALSPGRAITQDALRAPLCVRRGEAVTVYGRADGIQVRTTARAKEDGSLGDLIAVESFQDRKGFFARVCGPREVEVLARAAQTDHSVASQP